MRSVDRREGRFADRLTSRSAAACLAVAGILAGVLVGNSALGTVPGCGFGSDAYPSQTAGDWTAHADHVVVATPVKERSINRRDYEEGRTLYDVEREVTFRADDVLWGTERPGRPVGAEFELVAPGWRVIRASGDRFDHTNANAPRFETGHTYLLALRWDAGRWAVLGEGAAVPFDDRTVGQGEWCGRDLSKEDVARGERFSRPDDTSLEESLLGRNAQAVTRELDKASRK
ncbi:hypothetical protein OG711_20965 [Streptomyces uncialis]|uniref:hypothetical protein n=1 Tax=Streptomyces uncialis TaxID=1048205 RepID=UPI002E309053|nr:hypothetical protein [Streptomyces uncialis]